MKKNIILSAVMIFGIGVLGGCNQATEDNNSTDIVDYNQESDSNAQLNDYEDNYANEDSNAQTFENLDVSLDEVVTIFENEHPDAFITNIEIDGSTGYIYYIVKGIDEQGEHELRINASTGEVNEQKTEELDLEDMNLEELEGLIPASEAINIAVELYPEATITSIDIDRSQSYVYWQVDIRHNSLSYGEVKIDAQTGEVVEVDR